MKFSSTLYEWLSHTYKGWRFSKMFVLTCRQAKLGFLASVCVCVLFVLPLCMLFTYSQFKAAFDIVTGAFHKLLHTHTVTAEEQRRQSASLSSPLHSTHTPRTQNPQPVHHWSWMGPSWIYVHRSPLLAHIPFLHCQSTRTVGLKQPLLFGLPEPVTTFCQASD